MKNDLIEGNRSVSHYGDMWSHQVRHMNQDEKQAFMKRLARLVNRDRMVAPVTAFMNQWVEQDEAEVKWHMKQVLQEDAFVQNSSNRSVYFMNATLFWILEHEIGRAAPDEVCLQDDDVTTLAQGLSYMKYNDTVTDLVDEQSNLLLAMGYAMQFRFGFVNNNDWDKIDEKQRVDYLSHVSYAADYALRVQYLSHLKTDYQPAKIELAALLDNSETVLGNYNATENIIGLRNDLDYRETMRVFCHEKAHQLSKRLHRDPDTYSAGLLKTEEYHIYDLNTNALQILKKRSNKPAYAKIYRHSPEERLARGGEPPPIMGEHYLLGMHFLQRDYKTLAEVFSKAPPSYDFVKQALATYRGYTPPKNAVSDKPKIKGIF